MSRIGLALAFVLLAPALPAQEQRKGCPEGYIEGPGSTQERVECIFVGYRQVDKPYSAPVPPGMDDFLAAVRDQVHEFADRLPNYICDQTTQRYKTSSNPPNWKRQDRIENEVLFVDGRESYRDYKRNGKKLKDPTPMVSGLWSTGEFGTMLLDLFDPTSAAEFTPAGEDTVQGVKTRMYEFSVEEQNSHWKLMMGEVFHPAYVGTIWIDPDTLLVRRLEVAAKELPVTYPTDVMEITVEFGPVEIGENEHLLAVNSGALGCRRWKKTCMKNESLYTNYRMFTAESTVMQTDSTVTFEGEAKDPPKK